jgi:curved DNA-binding protein
MASITRRQGDASIDVRVYDAHSGRPTQPDLGCACSKRETAPKHHLRNYAVTMAKDLYAVLGVPRDADEESIKKAFRKLAMKYHPDKNPGKGNEQRFKDVNRAHEVLADKEKRALYDEFGEASLSQNFDADRARVVRNYGGGGPGPRTGQAVNVEEIFSGGGRADFGDLFGDLFGRGRAGRGAAPQPARGPDIESSVTVDFAAAVKGTTLELARDNETVTVRIPAGAKEGSRVRIHGQGAPGAMGGPQGDLLLTIHVTPHPFFRREGDDLYVDLPITLGEAYEGAKVRVPTPEGEVTLKVPPRTQAGQVTRLRGKGVARRGREAGDLYVKFVVHVPTSDDPEVARAVALLAAKVEDPRTGFRL